MRKRPTDTHNALAFDWKSDVFDGHEGQPFRSVSKARVV